MATNSMRAATDRPEAVAVDTRTRIVDCAIRLFNQHGLQSVTIEQICTELKISPGNLTYHFKRKDDLIRATLDALKERMVVALQKPVQVNSAQDGADYLARLFRTLWEFRFYFNALAYLLTDDATRRKEYGELRAWVIDTMEADLRYMTSRGLFKTPTPPNNFRLLGENIWSLLLDWLRLQHIATPAAPTPPDKDLFDIALHLWSMCESWMDPGFAKQLLQMFESMLLAKAAPRRAGGRPKAVARDKAAAGRVRAA
jgi:AcrR family transcriptional regulator